MSVAGVVSLTVRDGAPLAKGKGPDAQVVLIFGGCLASTLCRCCCSGFGRSPQRMLRWRGWRRCTARWSGSGRQARLTANPRGEFFTARPFNETAAL